MTPHDFGIKKDDGEKWEKKIIPVLERLQIKLRLEKQDYNTVIGKQKQHQGIDLTTNSKLPTYDIKTNATKYYDNGKMLIETTSIKHTNTPGWIYTSKADFIVHVWKNQNETNLMPKGYIIQLEELRKTRLYRELGKYKIWETSSRRGNSYWKTEFVLVPIEDFPAETLYIFNPHIPSLDAKQLKITKYTDPRKTTLGDFPNA